MFLQFAEQRWPLNIGRTCRTKCPCILTSSWQHSLILKPPFITLISLLHFSKSVKFVYSSRLTNAICVILTFRKRYQNSGTISHTKSQTHKTYFNVNLYSIKRIKEFLKFFFDGFEYIYKFFYYIVVFHILCKHSRMTTSLSANKVKLFFIYYSFWSSNTPCVCFWNLSLVFFYL